MCPSAATTSRFWVEGPKHNAERAVALLRSLLNRAKHAVPPKAFTTTHWSKQAGVDAPAVRDLGDDGEIVLHTRRADLRAHLAQTRATTCAASWRTTSRSASARPAPARPISPWRAP